MCKDYGLLLVVYLSQQLPPVPPKLICHSVYHCIVYNMQTYCVNNVIFELSYVTDTFPACLPTIK